MVAASRHLVLSIVLLAMAAPSAAIDVRQTGAPPSYDIVLARGYGTCTAPNDVSQDGVAACSPPTTSTCTFVEARLAVHTTTDGVTPLRFPEGNFHFARLPGGPPVCDTTDYYADMPVRLSADFFEDPEDQPCVSGRCTFPIVVEHHGYTNYDGFIGIFGLAPLEPPRSVFPIDSNVEIFGTTMMGPDGLPLASAGLAPDRSARITTNLTLPYEPCVPPPGAACNAPPVTSSCDFRDGLIAWTQGHVSELPTAHVTLADLAGTSPLCTSGTYHLEATVRATMNGCGSVDAPHACTLVDQTFLLPLIAKGGGIDATPALPLGPVGANGAYLNTEVLAFRVLDPMGQPLAVPGVTTVRQLPKARVRITGDAIRVQATIPIEFYDRTIDPTLAYGATVTVMDRDGPVYAVTIPSTMWQLQPPIGAKWSYRDPGGVIGGVRKAQIKRIGAAGLHKGYQIQLQAEGAPIAAVDFPGVTVHVAVPRSELESQRAELNLRCRLQGPKATCK